jgi:hypothetical protein
MPDEVHTAETLVCLDCSSHADAHESREGRYDHDAESGLAPDIQWQDGLCCEVRLADHEREEVEERDEQERILVRLLSAHNRCLAVKHSPRWSAIAPRINMVACKSG